MGYLGIKEKNWIIFQLIKFNPVTGDTVEVAMQMLTVMPTEIQYVTPSRNVITQTKNGIWLDKFGLGLEQITLRGTFGRANRQHGINLLDGFTRLQNFGKIVMELYHTTEPKPDLSPESKAGSLKQRVKQTVSRAKSFIGNFVSVGVAKLEQGEIYVLNYYDFYFGKRYAVNPVSFQVRGNARESNFLPRYNIVLTPVGDVIVPKVQDLLMKGLLKADGVMGKANDILQELSAIEGAKKLFDTGIKKLNIKTSMNKSLGNVNKSVKKIGKGVKFP